MASPSTNDRFTAGAAWAAFYERFRGTVFPFARPSDRPTPVACFRLFTVPPFPPLPRCSVPRLRRRMARSTSLLAPRLYFRRLDFRPLDFLVAIALSSRPPQATRRPVLAMHRGPFWKGLIGPMRLPLPCFPARSKASAGHRPLAPRHRRRSPLGEREEGRPWKPTEGS